MPRTNGRAERVVALVKDMIEKNCPLYATDLAALMCALNNRILTVSGAGSAAQRFYGREAHLGLPTLSPVISEEKRAEMMNAMRNHRTRYGKSLQTHNAVKYCIGQKVLVFSPKEGQFCDTGTIESWSPENDGLGPRDYSVRMESGSLRKVTNSWLSPLPGAENPQV